ncbi:MAG: hypothetical protein M1818_002379 [Claussenomyces sp. TS43310]|nr:MAG: hypothetical protein M1818_002379 [Claussenomyces sp. TS43310]
MSTNNSGNDRAPTQQDLQFIRMVLEKQKNPPVRVTVLATAETEAGLEPQSVLSRSEPAIAAVTPPPQRRHADCHTSSPTSADSPSASSPGHLSTPKTHRVEKHTTLTPAMRKMKTRGKKVDSYALHKERDDKEEEEEEPDLMKYESCSESEFHDHSE